MCFIEVLHNLLQMLLLSKNELVTFKLQIRKSTSVQCGIVEGSLNCCEMSLILWLLKS